MNSAVSTAMGINTSGPRGGDPLDHIAAALQNDGYTVLPAPLPPEVLTGLLDHFKSIEPKRFKRAGIGREADYQLNPFVRSDKIFWLDNNHPAASAYLDWMESLRLGLNRRLFLGLFDYECHYARYDSGAFYKKHLDAFKGQANRVLTTVLYLTPDWQPRDGGELLIYPPGEAGMKASAEPLLRVEPRFGRMVIFLSEEFPHEVLPTRRPRYSIAGWFRVNGSLGEAVDPAR